MEFQAEEIGGKIDVKAIIEKIVNSSGGTDIIVHVPSFILIDKLKKLKEKELKKDGKRDI